MSNFQKVMLSEFFGVCHAVSIIRIFCNEQQKTPTEILECSFYLDNRIVLDTVPYQHGIATCHTIAEVKQH